MTAAIGQLRAAGIEEMEAAASARWLLKAAQSSDSQCWLTTFGEFIDRRARHEPVQYIIGSWPFHPLPVELLLRPPVLIPRPETEELVDRVCQRYGDEAEARPPRLIADVGSGSGAICIALLLAFPAARGIAVEPSAKAAALTAENAMRCEVDGQLRVEQCTVQEWALAEGRVAVDLLLSNPPYIPTGEMGGLAAEVRCFEDELALHGGPDGLDVVREVLSVAVQVCTPGARIFLEVHHTHPVVFERAAAASSTRGPAAPVLHHGGSLELTGLHLIGTESDMSGLPRFVELQVL